MRLCPVFADPVTYGSTDRFKNAVEAKLTSRSSSKCIRISFDHAIIESYLVIRQNLMHRNLGNLNF